MTLLRIGDAVTYRPRFGQGVPRPARVTGLTLVEYHVGGTIETPVDAIPWESVKGRGVMIDLDNNSWAYGDQIERTR